jgi:hypothetical protein
MVILAGVTLPGAEFDSSERDPPPSCHPGTRLDISGEIQSWMRDPARTSPILWLNGPAGVGKSAIAQTISDLEFESSTSILGSTLFFSKVQRRGDPKRVFVTLAYQLAVKYPSYRKYVVDMLVRDPNAVHKSMAKQFKQFILQPIGAENLFEGLGTAVLMVLDGFVKGKK